MKIKRIASNLYNVPGFGDVVVPTGIQFRQRELMWMITPSVAPDLAGEDRYYHILDYSSPIMALKDAINTLESQLDQMYVGRRIGFTPRRDKGSNLIRGLYNYNYTREYFAISNPLEGKTEYFYVGADESRQSRESLKSICEARRMRLVEKYREKHRYENNL